MLNKRLWLAASMLIAFLLLAGCGTSEQDKLVGTWKLINIEAMVRDQDVDFADFEEYRELGLVWDFASNGTFSYEIAFFLDLGTMIREIMDDTAEVDAGPVYLKITLEGTYEKTDDGMFLLIYDTDSVTSSPDEYCYRVGDFDQCMEIGDLSAGFEDFLLFETGGAFYEIDGETLTMWAATCDYPEDQACAAHFTQ